MKHLPCVLCVYLTQLSNNVHTNVYIFAEKSQRMKKICSGTVPMKLKRILIDIQFVVTDNVNCTLWIEIHWMPENEINLDLSDNKTRKTQSWKGFIIIIYMYKCISQNILSLI